MELKSVSKDGETLLPSLPAPPSPPPFYAAAHADFVAALEERMEGVEYAASEYLRASGVYWGLCACETLGSTMSASTPRFWVLSPPGRKNIAVVTFTAP